jgi:putative transposase
LREVDSISLQQSLKDLDKAFKSFFKGLGGFPKFKSKKNNKQSYRTQYFKSSSGNESIEIKDNKIKLPKLSWVKFRKSREVTGKIQIFLQVNFVANVDIKIKRSKI